jgi:hypothetical protein
MDEGLKRQFASKILNFCVFLQKQYNITDTDMRKMLKFVLNDYAPARK